MKINLTYLKYSILLISFIISMTNTSYSASDSDTESTASDLFLSEEFADDDDEHVNSELFAIDNVGDLIKKLKLDPEGDHACALKLIEELYPDAIGKILFLFESGSDDLVSRFYPNLIFYNKLFNSIELSPPHRYLEWKDPDRIRNKMVYCEDRGVENLIEILDQIQGISLDYFRLHNRSKSFKKAAFIVGFLISVGVPFLPLHFIGVNAESSLSSGEQLFIYFGSMLVVAVIFCFAFKNSHIEFILNKLSKPYEDEFLEKKDDLKQIILSEFERGIIFPRIKPAH